MARLLDIDETTLRATFDRNRERGFIYVKPAIAGAIADQVEKLGIGGIHESQFKRSIEGEITSQLVGFTISRITGEGWC